MAWTRLIGIVATILFVLTLLLLWVTGDGIFGGIAALIGLPLLLAWRFQVDFGRMLGSRERRRS